MLEAIMEVNDTLKYVILFLLAAAPWLEVFLVVPLGIIIGLSPIIVALLGFLGNWFVIILITLLFHKLTEWWRKRKGKEMGNERKRSRAKKIWDRYGVPGLAILAPTIVGTDIATILALSFGSSKKWVFGWMTVSLALWTIVLALGTVYGIDFVGYLKGIWS